MTTSPAQLQVTQDGPVAWVVIDRAPDRNSLNSPLMAELGLLLERLEAEGLRAAVFRGAGDTHFIGGADGIEMMQCDPVAGQRFSHRIQALFDRMEQSPLVLVAAINGLCFGGGFEFALACDLRVAVENARIGLPEVKVGLIPGGGGTQRLPRLVGAGLAMEMILTGRLYEAREAQRLGLINHCTPSGGLRPAVDDLLDRVLRQPAHAVALAKQAVKQGGRLPLHEGLRVEAERFSHCFSHAFFRDLMRQQLREGSLKTTAPLPPGFLEDER